VVCSGNTLAALAGILRPRDHRHAGELGRGTTLATATGEHTAHPTTPGQGRRRR
jgi:hypothetical protein